MFEARPIDLSKLCIRDAACRRFEQFDSHPRSGELSRDSLNRHAFGQISANCQPVVLPSCGHDDPPPAGCSPGMLMEQGMEIAISNHVQPYSCTLANSFCDQPKLRSACRFTVCATDAVTAVGSQDALMYAIPFAVRPYVYCRNFEPKPRPDRGHTP